MKYPAIEEVEKADHEQICRWYRFLPSPGSVAIGSNFFEAVLRNEKFIMDKILQRFKELGGFTPELSKKIGW